MVVDRQLVMVDMMGWDATCSTKVLVSYKKFFFIFLLVCFTLSFYKPDSIHTPF